MKISEKGLQLLKQIEGFRASPYKDSAGLLTVGYGHLITETDRKLNRFESPLTQDAASDLLRHDVLWAEQAINKFVRVPLFPCQFDALVLFVFNVGVGNLLSSNLLKRVNAGETNLAEEFLRWNKARDPKTGDLIASKGLTSRREQEATLWSEVTA